MTTLTIQDIKTNGSKAIPDDETSFLIVNSVPKSALVPMDIYQSYVEALEELEDLKITLDRMDDEEVPAEKVFAKLLGPKSKRSKNV